MCIERTAPETRHLLLLNFLDVGVQRSLHLELLLLYLTLALLQCQ
jgi:hypothetical protein